MLHLVRFDSVRLGLDVRFCWLGLIWLDWVWMLGFVGLVKFDTIFASSAFDCTVNELMTVEIIMVTFFFMTFFY